LKQKKKITIVRGMIMSNQKHFYNTASTVA